MVYLGKDAASDLGWTGGRVDLSEVFLRSRSNKVERVQTYLVA